MRSITVQSDMTGDNWGLARIIRRRQPWDRYLPRYPIDTFYDASRNGAGVDIYVLDTGVRTTHDEFGGRASTIYEYAAGGDEDYTGHGTAMASYAAGGTTGVASAANIFSLRIATDSSGNSSNAAFIAAASAMLTHYAGRTNPAICNVSFMFYDSGIATAVAAILDAGIPIVAAAGNDGRDLDTSTVLPINGADVIGVGAIGPLDTPAYFLRPEVYTLSQTAYGSTVDVVAPGQLMMAADPASDTGYHLFSSSTSGAAAMASGALACMLEGRPKMTSRSEVQALSAELLAAATTGKLVIPPGGHVPPGGLPDRILYLDPEL